MAPESPRKSLPNPGVCEAAYRFEVSLFGPGYGEALAIDLGEGKWALVDSCLDAETGESPVLGYLSERGVDPARDVVGVVATHWHDDHIRGIAELFQACSSATFFCANAMSSREFATLTALPIQGADRLSSGIREFLSVFDIVRQRKEAGLPGVNFVGANTIVYEGADFELRALSPSSEAFRRAMVGISKLLPKERQSHLRVAAPSPNEASVALWLKGRGGAALLGADVERASSSDRGWGAIVALNPARDGKAGLLKVPHHGGESAHDDVMWDALVADDPKAYLTPWIRAGDELPTREDEVRIIQRAPEPVLVGATPKRVERYPSAVERTVQSVVKGRRRAVGQMGHARARLCDAEGGIEWQIERISKASILA